MCYAHFSLDYLEEAVTLKCTYVISRKEDLNIWLDSLNEAGDPYALLLVKPLPDALIFETRDGDLNDLALPMMMVK